MDDFTPRTDLAVRLLQPVTSTLHQTNNGESPMPYVYILRCNDGSFYVGQTIDLERRFTEHQSGVYEGCTHSRRPVAWVWPQDVQTDNEVFLLERKFKGWSRVKKEALIRGDFDALHEIVKAERRRREKANAAKTQRKAS